MDEATNPHGVLETLETRQDEVPKLGEIRCMPFQCRNPGKFERRLLADCQQPDFQAALSNAGLDSAGFQYFYSYYNFVRT